MGFYKKFKGLKRETKEKIVWFLLGMAFLTLIYSVILIATILNQIALSPELSLKEFPQILVDRLQLLLRPINLTIQANRKVYKGSSIQ